MKAHTYRKLTLFVLSIVMTGMFQLHAQNERDYRWKVQNNRGDRYEGTYTSPSPYRDLTLLAYYAGIKPYSFNAGQKLSVHFYSPYQAPAYLKAEELNIRNRYWMQTKEGITNYGWNTYRNWKVDSYLREGRVTAGNLGITARVKMGSFYGEHYLPVILNQEGLPSRITQYRVYFRNNFHMERGVIRIYPGLAGEEGPTEKKLLGAPINISQRVAGGIFSLPLDQNRLGTYTGWINVQITYKKWNQAGTYTEVYSLYHPGWFK